MEEFLNAITTFCSPQSKSDQVREADEYLKQIERSKDSWLLVIAALEKPGLQIDSYFLSAKILKTKLQFDFAQLLPAEATQLPSRLLNLLQIHKESQRSIQGQLVEAFNYCYLHLFQSLPNLLEFIQQNFYADSKMQNYIFTIFEYLPDNVFSNTVVMDEQHKTAMIEYFKENMQNSILLELDKLGRSQGIEEKVQYRLLKILSNWIDFKSNQSILETLLNHSVFNLALVSLSSSALQEFSAASIIGTLRQLKSQQIRTIYSDLFQKIAKHVFGYFAECLQAQKDGDVETVQHYSRVLVRFGRCAMSEFLQESGIDAGSQKYLENMLEVTKLEGIDTEEEMTQFWTQIISEILSINDSTHQQLLITRFKTLIAALFEVCIKKLTYTSEIFNLLQSLTDNEVEMKSESFELQNKTRFYLKEIIVSISQLIGTEDTIVYLAGILKSSGILNESVGENANSGNSLSADHARFLESIIFCLTNVLYDASRRTSNSADQPNNPDQLGLSENSINYSIDILVVVLQIRSEWVRLNRTIFSLLITSSRFLSRSLPACQLSFNLVVSQLDSGKLQEVAFSSFEVLCKDCPGFVQSNLETFMSSVYSTKMFNQSIISGITYAICANDECIQSYFVKLCLPYATDLLNYTRLPLEQQTNEEYITALKKPLKALKNIISCVPERTQRGVFPHSLLREIFEQIWPVLKVIMENQAKDTQLVESIISILKQFIQKMQLDFDVFLEEFLVEITNLYTKSDQAGILYIVERCVRIFSNDFLVKQKLSNAFRVSFEILVSHTLKLIPDIGDYVDNPGLVEDFFGFLEKFIKYLPDVFFSSEYIQQILIAAQKGIQLQHPDAAKTLFLFIESVYMFFQNPQADQTNPQILQFKHYLFDPISVQNNFLLFRELSEVPSRNIRDYIFDIFMAQITVFKSLAVHFFKPVIDNLSIDVLTELEKERFIAVIQSVKDSLDQQTEKEIIQFLILISDRYRQSYRRNHN